MKEDENRSVKVSVIVPVYNAEDTLKKCIDSILSQTYQIYELILVDDGSVDNSRMILEDYKIKDSRVVLISQSNKGVSAARNRGIENSQGEWITFVDADDYLSEDCLESAVHAVCRTGCDMLFWNRKDIYQDRIEEKRVFCDESTEGIYHSRELIQKVFYNSEGNVELCSACCRLFKRNIIMKNQLRFSEDLHQGEDMVFMTDYFMAVQKVLRSDSFTYYRTMRDNSAMHQYNPEIKKYMLNLMVHLEKQVGQLNDKKIRSAYAVFVFRGPVTGYLESFVCHKKNKASHRVRRRQLKEFLEVPMVKSAVGSISYHKLPVRLKIKLFCVRHRILLILDKWYQSKCYL